MYARGMTVREIQGHLLELYGLEVSPDLISTVTDAVLETVAEWQNRPLETSYPLVFFDAIRVKIRDEGLVRNKAVYLALGAAADGTKDILALWIETTEGAKFWLKVMNDLKARGVEDILIAMVDGLRGFPEAIEAVFPQAPVQTCIVHLIRNSLDSCPGKTASPWSPSYGKFTAPPTLRPAARPFRPSKTAHGAANMRRSANPGGGNGSRSSRSSPLLWPCAKSSTPRCYRGLERQAATGRAGERPFTSDEAATKLISWSCARSLSNGKCRLANGPRLRPSSPSCSAIASSEPDGNPAPCAKFRQSPLRPPGWSIAEGCRLTGSRSAYYDAPVSTPDDTAIVEAISAICDEVECHSWRRVQASLRQQGIAVNHKKMKRLMRKPDLHPRMRRRYVATRDSDHDPPIFCNLAKDKAINGATYTNPTRQRRI